MLSDIKNKVPKTFNLLLRYSVLIMGQGTIIVHQFAVGWTNKPCFYDGIEITLLFISVINQLDAQNFCFTISLFHASTCFEHMCSKHVKA